MQVFFFVPPVTMSKSKEESNGLRRAHTSWLCNLLSQRALPEGFQTPQQQSCPPSRARPIRVRAKARGSSNSGTYIKTVKQWPGAWLRPPAHCRHHLTRNEQQAPLSRNLLVATITCPSCMQVSFDQVLHSQMWLRDSPLGLTTETGFRSQISVRYLFF